MNIRRFSSAAASRPSAVPHPFRFHRASPPDAPTPSVATGRPSDHRRMTGSANAWRDIAVMVTFLWPRRRPDQPDSSLTWRCRCGSGATTAPDAISSHPGRQTDRTKPGPWHDPQLADGRVAGSGDHVGDAVGDVLGGEDLCLLVEGVDHLAADLGGVVRSQLGVDPAGLEDTAAYVPLVTSCRRASVNPLTPCPAARSDRSPAARPPLPERGR
jgi:hypothetical protein